MKHIRVSFGVAAAVLLLVSATLLADTRQTKVAVATAPAVEETPLSRQVRHQLVTLPWYSVFDNLEYSIEGDTVALSGQVNRPTMKSAAEAAVKGVAGVSKVLNNIEVLPLSPNDDRIRLAVYRTLFSASGLDRYAMSAVPSIHIVVKNGHVTLTGVVDRQTDGWSAEILAKGVSGVFSVANELRVRA